MNVTINRVSCGPVAKTVTTTGTGLTTKVMEFETLDKSVASPAYRAFSECVPTPSVDVENC